MHSVAVETIQERIRQLCDLPVFAADTNPTSAAILDLIAASTVLLAGLVKERSDELYFVNSDTFSTQGGLPFVSLPTDSHDIIRVSWQKSASEDIDLDIADSSEFVAYPSAWGGVRPKYRIIGQTIEFFPTPDAAYDVKIYYSTGLYVTSTEQSISVRDGWDQWIVYQTAILVRTRLKQDFSEFAMLLDALTERVQRQLRRDKHGIRQVRDLRSQRTPKHGRWW